MNVIFVAGEIFQGWEVTFDAPPIGRFMFEENSA